MKKGIIKAWLFGVLMSGMKEIDIFAEHGTTIYKHKDFQYAITGQKINLYQKKCNPSNSNI